MSTPLRAVTVIMDMFLQSVMLLTIAQKQSTTKVPSVIKLFLDHSCADHLFGCRINKITNRASKRAYLLAEVVFNGESLIQFTPHPIGGKIPHFQCAGLIELKDGWVLLKGPLGFVRVG